MLKTSFLHIAITVLLISIYPWIETLSFSLQLQITLGIILILGVPHGAIDHLLLYKKQQQKGISGINFYFFYLGLIAAYVLLWLLLPYLSLFLFFLISFYHFGQSQFSFVNMNEKNLLKISLYLAWGGSIVAGLFYYHYAMLIGFFNETSHFAATSSFITQERLLIFFIVCTLLSVALMSYCLLRIQKDVKRFWGELGILALLHLAFYTLPPLIAFSIYFAVWHSLRVLHEEYRFLLENKKIKGTTGFIQLLLPYSSISIVGAIILLLGFSYFEIQISPFFLTIIFLSVLTLPHSVVMANWYKSFRPSA